METVREELKTLINEATCSFCLDYSTDSTKLDCGHIYCRECVECLVMEQGDTHCPQCSQHCTMRDDLPSIVGSEGRQSPCREAELGCEEHDERLRVFCETDQRAICLKCVKSIDHRTHMVTPIREATALYKRKLQELMEKISRHADEVLETRREEENTVADVKRQMVVLRENMAREFGKLHLFLSNEEEALAQRLKEREADLLVKLEKSIRKTSRESSMVQQLIRNIQQRLDKHDSDLLKNIKQVLESLGQTCDEFEVPLRVPVDLGLGEMNGPLLYTVWKRMLQVITPVPALLKLDASTAHPRLMISEDGAEVRLSPGHQSVGESPARFSDRRSVLGAQSFCSGRHYWEVEVGNSPVWSLGLAAESIPRVGSSLLCPKTGLWAVGLQWQEGYRALSSPPTLLTPPHRPKKVGVYLDYEGGQVSFYNADNMSHLHTFTETFTEKLYPYLSTASKAQSLRLVSLPYM